MSTGRARWDRIGLSTPTPPPTSSARPRSSSTAGRPPRSTWSTPHGAFVGGAIAPGLQLGLEALATRTARLPLVELRVPDGSIGRDTAAAIRVGTVLGHKIMIEGILGRIRREVAAGAGIAPHDVRAILTGGLSAHPWARTIEGLDGIDPDLTLKGLVHFHRVIAGDEAQS